MRVRLFEHHSVQLNLTTSRLAGLVASVPHSSAGQSFVSQEASDEIQAQCLGACLGGDCGIPAQ